MGWNDALLDRLAAHIPCGYHPGGPASSEPTALAAIALSAANRDAARAIDWLAACQSADGSVGPTAPRPSESNSARSRAQPGWPTGWAVLAAIIAEDSKARRAEAVSPFNVSRAVQWILKTAGDSAETDETLRKTAKVGWPWVNGTYSWVEPTAIHTVALKAAGYASHTRTQEAMAMLVERLLPSGGCNYGNTVVLGQELRPHIQPTGLAMLALAGQADSDERIERSLDYLATNLSAETTSASLAYGLIGLAAHDRYPAGAANWLEAAYRHTMARDGAAYKLALLSLAALGVRLPAGDNFGQNQNYRNNMAASERDSEFSRGDAERGEAAGQRAKPQAEARPSWRWPNALRLAGQFRPPRVARRLRRRCGRALCVSDGAPVIRAEGIGVHRSQSAIRRPAWSKRSAMGCWPRGCNRRPWRASVCC